MYIFKNHLDLKLLYFMFYVLIL